MNDITSLDGYEALRQSAIDALRERASKESPWVFENDQDIDLSDLVKDRRSRTNNGKPTNELNGIEMVQAALGGRVFSVHEQYDVYDNTSEQDDAWVQSELQEVIDHEVAQAIERFAEQNDLESDEVEEALKNDDALEAMEVFDYSLHHNKYEFKGSVPMQIKLPITLNLEPTLDTAKSLAHLRIPLKTWIEAVNRTAEDFPDGAIQFAQGTGTGTEFKASEFAKKMSDHVSALSARGVVFETNPDNAFVDAHELIDHLSNHWQTPQTDFVLRFNLGPSHVDNVSMPVARTLEDHEIDKMPILLMGNVELMPNETCDSGKGTGLVLKRPFACKLGDLSVANDDSDDRDEPETRLAGSLGLLLRAYETLLEHEDSEKLIEAARSSLQSGGPTVKFPEQVADALQTLFSEADGFEAERVAAKYPGLLAFLPPDKHPSAKDLGDKLLDLLSLASNESIQDWGASEVRERAAWLVARGADLNMRVGGARTGPKAVHLAAWAGDIDMVRDMHGRGADVTELFRPQFGGKNQRFGVWEALAGHCASRRKYDKSAVISQWSEGLIWLESLSGHPDALNVTVGKYGAPISMRGSPSDERWTTIDQAVAMIDNPVISRNHVRRLSGEGLNANGVEPGSERLSRALLAGLMADSSNFSRTCIDAGASISAPLDGSTVETLARNQAAVRSFERNTAIDDVVAYVNALLAREAIDSLDGMIQKLKTNPKRQSPQAHAPR